MIRALVHYATIKKSQAQYLTTISECFLLIDIVFYHGKEAVAKTRGDGNHRLGRGAHTIFTMTSKP